MAIMNNFFCCCSVRLGAIVIGIISIIQAIIPLCVFGIIGIDEIKSKISSVDVHAPEEFGSYENDHFYEKIVKYVNTDSDSFWLCIIIYLAIYIITCLLEIVGAYKMYKWLLLPYILFEFIRIIILFATHIIGMMLAKTIMNLGSVITTTVFGVFLLLLIIYLWACVIALFQILTIVKSKKYQSLYGNNPLAPFNLPNDQHQLHAKSKDTNDNVNNNSINKNKGIIENVKLYPEPDFTNNTPLKYDKTSAAFNKNIEIISMNLHPNNINMFAKEFYNLDRHRKKLMNVKQIIMEKRGV